MIARSTGCELVTRNRTARGPENHCDRAQFNSAAGLFAFLPPEEAI
jgi:hypothetical protein